MGPGVDPAKGLVVFTPCQPDERPRFLALSACKGQLQRLLQGVKPAAGRAGVNLCFGLSSVTGRKEVLGCAVGGVEEPLLYLGEKSGGGRGFVGG